MGGAKAVCRYCSEPIRWSRSKKTGKWMILDRDPLPGGNVSLESGSNFSDGVPRAVVHGHPSDLQGSLQLDIDGSEKVLAYVVHQANCKPYNEEHGRKTWR